MKSEAQLRAAEKREAQRIAVRQAREKAFERFLQQHYPRHDAQIIWDMVCVLDPVIEWMAASAYIGK